MSNQKKKAPRLSKAQVAGLEQCDTMAAKIRYLNAEGFGRGDISRALNIRYQWVRNVLITPLKGQ